MHLVARGTWAARLATGCYPRCLVVPSGKKGARITDREVGLPLRLSGVSVSVQLEWRAEGDAHVGGTNVENVARVITAAVGSIVVVNNVVVSSNLTPAHVPPVSRAGVHVAEETRR